MLNLTLKELRLIAKNRNINDYESMPKDKRDKKSLFNSKKRKPTKVFISQQETLFLN